ncbi:MAG: hypothetical protein GY729_16325 [Desulfobacteraceae bacterium]|nr:hypothetical protein [Desulfobacteraceae bacterium]
MFKKCCAKGNFDYEAMMKQFMGKEGKNICSNEKMKEMKTTWSQYCRQNQKMDQRKKA